MNQPFLVIYRPSSAWVPGHPVWAQPPTAHGHYLLSLYQQVLLLFAGPFDDDTGAELMLEAADEIQARALVDADPTVRESVFT